ncbi:serine hydrolase [Sphingomonas sp. SUN039]|uniref:serine hydrolase domain-containing protein n=1 Tax=Sphingomonas sp. SUN039 TaxID=2937787 RepID=UPI002164710E|nr:serine hydrolase domain-containing protein [Sphingomonas sp. SUN039]UVO53430.1 beta-lactamase family protein [Sphingomonas sp. SUN039]
MRRFGLAILGAAMLLGACDTIKLYSDLPKDKNVLFWTQDQRDNGFRALEKLATVRGIPAGGSILAFGQGVPLKLPIDIDAYMKSQRSAGLIVIQDNKIRFEKYALGYSPQGRWTSFSVAKSFTSTLVGAAVKDGYIKSLDDKVTQYIPTLRGSVYDDVTVKQLLTMTSGVKWNEDYADPKSDVAQFALQKPVPGEDITVSYMKKLTREAPAGTKWVYKTGETNLIGVLVSSATGKSLSAYLSDKVWKPFGMEADAFWILGDTGHEISGCCLSARLRDYARFGQFVLEGGPGTVPDGWFAAATTKQADIGQPGRGYGYQWWTNDDGSFAAQGIFGQGIFIDPKRKLVIASNGNWPKATDPDTVGAERERFYKAVQAAVDAGR